jgi:hypothetical protein
VRPLGPRGSAAAIALALALFAVAFAVEVAIRPGNYIRHSDVPLYSEYGSEIVGGALPYRDFYFEYPPGALPMFALPATRVVALGSTSGASWDPTNAAARRYHRGFVRLVFLLGAAIVVLTALTLAALRRPGRAVALSLAVVSLSPLLIGDVYPERFDVWPAAFTAAALAAAVRGRYKLGGAALGLAAAAKVYPVLLLPVLLIVVVRHRGLREAAFVAATAVGAALAVFLPFAITSFSATWQALRIQFEGGLQVESIGSAVLVLASHASRKLAAMGLPGPFSVVDRAAEHGLSRGVLVGPGTAAATTVLNVLVVVALLWLWVSLLRSGADPREDLVRYAAATVVTAVALGSVLSPQYLIWLVPLVPLVGGRRGAAATLAFAVAAVLTHLWFPWGYFKYTAGLDVGPTTLLLARDLALLATAVVLVLPRRTLDRLRFDPVRWSRPGADSASP